MNTIFLWLRIIRPQTLFASFCPVAIALLIGGIYRPWIALITCCCALSLQILANLINDYYDYVRGADQKGRAGYKRALSEGEVTPDEMKKACFITATLTVLLGIPLVFIGKWFILGIGILSLFFAWLYTATKHSLAYIGLGDVFVLIFFGIVPAMGTEYLQHGYFSQNTILCSTVCGLLSMCVLMINNLRDIESDAKSGKRTFPVRFGKKNGERLFLCILIAIVVCLYCTWKINILMSIPILGLGIYLKVLRCHGKEYNRCLLFIGLLNLLYVIETAIMVILIR